MPNQTIDLWRGLEAWYDFDPRYYDNQRGVLADKSGYGRTAEAEGGPTVGVEGPDSFNAIQFDGDDDYFSIMNPPGFQDGEPWTFFTLVNHDGGAREPLIARESDNERLINVQDETLSFLDEDFTATEFGFVPPSEWSSVVLTTDGTDMWGYINTPTVSGTGTPSTTQMDFGWIGRSSNNSQYLSGKMAVSAVWERQISQPEIGLLHNLTGPQRSL